VKKGDGLLSLFLKDGVQPDIRHTGHTRDALHEAFVLRRETLPLHVVLIDDIATTGSTLDACAEVLKMAGVEYVEALVIAKG
jgi:predicted amidophosphoribosyltransferase